MIKEFKAFVLRGNVVDLAIAVVIGGAFGALVAAFVKDLLTPLISIPGKADFQSLTFTINGSVFRYGDFFNAVIAFVSVAAAVFFFVVKPLNRMRGVQPDEDVEMRECPECLTSIPAAALRCSACTAKLTPVRAA
ncbi:MAG: large conductance mechanosensitive channel protein MscL [Acidimicrobiia bacterium]|nr:large conductance mechanosensitive channel protein MscL [Acidimicrobiia bacterium]